MTIINQPRKIIVTGCANCPYRNATTEGVDGTVHLCTHCSFIGKHPIINHKYIDNLINAQSDMIHSDYFPDWCPLDLETRHYYTCNTTEI